MGRIEGLEVVRSRIHGYGLVATRRFAAGEPGGQRDPSGVTAHHLDHDDPLVALRRGVQALERLDDDLDGGLEPDGVVGRLEVVVDRLGHADDVLEALVDELLRERHRAVAADDDQALEGELVQVRHALLRHVHDLDAAVGQLDRVRERVRPVARAEHRPAARQHVRHLRGAEVDVLLLVEALEPVPDPDDLPAVGLSGVEGHRADDTVEARAVTTAGQDPDARAHDQEAARDGTRSR